jgi:hypothetical protein
MAPTFYLHIIILQEFLRFNLPMKRVRLNLIYGRNNFIVDDQINKPVRVKVAYADGPNSSFFVQIRMVAIHRTHRRKVGGLDTMSR